MINAKVRTFEGDYTVYLENEINEFLKTIDVRQIIKTEFLVLVEIFLIDTRLSFTMLNYQMFAVLN
jgi:hypothetical protein